MIGKLELYALGAILLAAAIAGAYFYAKHQGVMEERGRWEVKAAAATKADIESLSDAVKKGSAIAQDTYNAVGKIKVVNRTINNEVQREIKTDVRYAADCLPDSGILLWNAANRGILPARPAGDQPPVGGRGLLAPR
jgi:hypothetical protein